MSASRRASEVISDYGKWADYFLGLRRYARSGDCLIGLGEVTQFFERVVDEYEELQDNDEIEVEVTVTISAVVRQEGSTHIVYAELNHEGYFELGEIARGDHEYSRHMHRWDPCEDRITFDECFEWREEFKSALSGGRLEVYRDHV